MYIGKNKVFKDGEKKNFKSLNQWDMEEYGFLKVLYTPKTSNRSEQNSSPTFVTKKVENLGSFFVIIPT